MALSISTPWWSWCRRPVVWFRHETGKMETSVIISGPITRKGGQRFLSYLWQFPAIMPAVRRCPRCQFVPALLQAMILLLTVNLSDNTLWRVPNWGTCFQLHRSLKQAQEVNCVFQVQRQLSDWVSDDDEWLDILASTRKCSTGRRTHSRFNTLVDPRMDPRDHFI